MCESRDCCILKTIPFNLIQTYNGEDNDPLEDDPADEAHRHPPEGVRAREDEQRAGQLGHPLLARHRRLPTPHRRHL